MSHRLPTNSHSVCIYMSISMLVSLYWNWVQNLLQMGSWGESLTREFEQNGFVFNESCNGNVLIYDPRLPNRASFIDTLTIYNT